MTYHRATGSESGTCDQSWSAGSVKVTESGRLSRFLHERSQLELFSGQQTHMLRTKNPTHNYNITKNSRLNAEVVPKLALFSEKRETEGRTDLEEDLQVDDSSTKGFPQIKDGVLYSVLLCVQVQDLFVERGCWDDHVVNVIVFRLVLHLLQSFAQFLVLLLEELDVSVHLSLRVPQNVTFLISMQNLGRTTYRVIANVLTTSWSRRDTMSSSFWCPFFRSSSVLFRASSSACALSISSFILQRSLSLTAEISDARIVSSPMVPSRLGPARGRQTPIYCHWFDELQAKWWTNIRFTVFHSFCMSLELPTCWIFLIH